VAEFLSVEWIAALAEAARAQCTATPGAATDPVVIQQIVDQPSGAAVAYHLVVAPGYVEVRPGLADQPTVTFRSDRQTAADVSRGEQSAQAAFMTGRLRVAGDVQLLASRQQLAAELDDLFAAVRASTTY
jgi:hypothetical protein